jgi:hypothetical protein
MRVSLREALSERRQSPQPYPPGRFEGRGIVICAGGPRYFTCAWVLISLLRGVYRVDLPIQVWHLGRREISEEMRLLLEGLQVEVVDAEAVVARFPARIAGGWPLKPYAIAHSRFREVLYLDSDTVPLAPPLQVFDWAGYREHGLQMWPDVIDLKSSNPIWDIVGLEPRDCTSVEAGVLVVDKQRVWNILDVAVLLNGHAEEIYGPIYGDKDTFLLSALLAGRCPVMIPHRPFVFGFSDLVQRDPVGDPFVHHRTGSKWHLTGANYPLALDTLTPHCEQALAELRRRWNGTIFHAPERSQRALAEEMRLRGADHRYEHGVSRARRIELLPGGRVGEGRAQLEQHWSVVERDGVLVLQFFSVDGLAVELTQSGDGRWEGYPTRNLAFSVRLVENAARRALPHEDCERISPSAMDWIKILLDASQFAAGFDAERARQLCAALSLLNERFDDIPEGLDAQLAEAPVPWQRALTDLSGSLAAQRDARIALTKRAAYPSGYDPRGYDRVP